MQTAVRDRDSICLHTRTKETNLVFPFPVWGRKNCCDPSPGLARMLKERELKINVL